MTVVASSYAREQNDLYQTEVWVTEALLRCLPFPIRGKFIWEPAAGNHLMADVLREAGADVFTSDIVTYDREHDQLLNFLTQDLSRRRLFDMIITNPPYGVRNNDAVKFARLSLKVCQGWVCLLLMAKFDFGKSRIDLFRKSNRFYGKIALLDRIQWFPGETSGTEDHAWYIWHPGTLREGTVIPQLFWEKKELVT